MTCRSRSMTSNIARAGASGVLRRYSQARSVVMDRWKASPNSAYLIPRRRRSLPTRDTRRILACASLFGVKGAHQDRTVRFRTKADLAATGHGEKCQNQTPSRSPLNMGGIGANTNSML
jgi:hypothetical protein